MPSRNCWCCVISVCVPVLKRYDLLRQLALSLRVSRVVPARLCVIDNGKNADALAAALDGAVNKQKTLLDILTPAKPMGVAESWNWFIDHVPEERVIANDDVSFAPESLGLLLASPADLIWAKGLGFSLFVLRDACVRKLGRFDEMISPGYGYYEDEDYLQRLDGRGTREPSAIAEAIDCGALHAHSATLKAMGNYELLEHHRKFKIARSNYMKKWSVSHEEMFG